MNDDVTFIDKAIEFVKLGYGDVFSSALFRSLNFRTDKLTTAQAQQVVRVLATYNAFDGEAVANSIERFAGRVKGWEFGREGSPVMYVRLAYTENQLEGRHPRQEPTRIDDSKHEALLEELHVRFSELGADEIEVDEQGRHDVRIWWD